MRLAVPVAGPKREQPADGARRVSSEEPIHSSSVSVQAPRMGNAFVPGLSLLIHRLLEWELIPLLTEQSVRRRRGRRNGGRRLRLGRHKRLVRHELELVGTHLDRCDRFIHVIDWLAEEIQPEPDYSFSGLAPLAERLSLVETPTFLGEPSPARAPVVVLDP